MLIYKAEVFYVANITLPLLIKNRLQSHANAHLSRCQSACQTDFSHIAA
jgi:hypothetical protein